MTTQHTPEPWCIYWANAPGEAHDIRSADRWVIAKVYGTGETLEEDQATREGNARRIVACVNACAGITDPETTIPELIEALRDCVAAVEHMSPTVRDQERYRKARAVLAKLEGGPQG